MIIAPHSALPSWEGFEYQGHISLYFALLYIWEEVEKGKTSDIGLYQLAIEGEEDFSVIKKDKYLSLHQVKQGSISLEDNDKFCFVISLLQYKADKGFFHINQNKILPEDFITVTLQEIDNLLTELKKPLITKTNFKQLIESLKRGTSKKYLSSSKDYKREEDKFIHINKINLNASKGSLYNILKSISIKPLTESSVLSACATLEKELLEYKAMLQNKKDSDFFEVFSDKYEDSQDVINRSLILIENILCFINPQGNMYYTQLYYQYIYDCLHAHLAKKRSEHSTVDLKNHCKVKFQELFIVITRDHKKESNTPEYQLYELFTRIYKEFEEYPSSRNSTCASEECSSCAKQDSCNLHKQLKQIEVIDFPNKKDLMYKLLMRTPENDLPENAFIRRMLLDLLYKLPVLSYYNGNTILAEKNGLIYRLTFDRNMYFYEFLDQLQSKNDISEIDQLLIYESDILITEHINEESFRYDQIRFNVLGENELEELSAISQTKLETDKKKFTSSKIMRLVSKKIAEQELREDA